jgi:dolichyl-phosphate-mannose-protein mannosyltransferase
VSAVADVLAFHPLAARFGGLPWTRLLRLGSLAAIVVGLAVGALFGEPQAIVVAVLGLALLLAVVWLGFRGADRSWLLTVGLVAFAVRLLGTVAAHYVLIYLGRGGFALLDDKAYDKLGWTLARVWLGVFPGIRDSDEYLLVNYTYLVALVYYTLGHSLLAAKMMNVAFGALSAVVFFALGREIFDRRAGQVLGLLTAFFASLVLWSTINLKDTLMVLLVGVTAYGLVRYAYRHEWWALGLTLLSFLAIENLRQFVFFVLTWLLPIAFLFADRSERSRNPLRLLLAVALGLLVTAWPAQYLYENGPRSYLIFLLPAFFLPTALLFAGSPGGRRKLLFLAPLVLAIVALSYATNNEKLGTNFLTPKALTEAEWKRWLEESKAAGTANDEFGGIKPPKEMDTIIERSLGYLPRGMVAVLFGPTPWEARSGNARAVIPDMLAWYAMLAAAVVGLAVVVRSRWRDLVLPLGFTAAWTVALALTEGNTGNIYRHRAMFMPFVFLLSAAGLVWVWDRWRAQRPAANPPGAELDPADSRLPTPDSRLPSGIS